MNRRVLWFSFLVLTVVFFLDFIPKQIQIKYSFWVAASGGILFMVILGQSLADFRNLSNLKIDKSLHKNKWYRRLAP
ncbi:hypothetical protein, partial [Salinivirga cyanobacteriivorans]